MRQKLKEKRFLYRQDRHGRDYPVIKIEAATSRGYDRERVCVRLRGDHLFDVDQSELTVDVPSRE
jgi:hypothetical protein